VRKGPDIPGEPYIEGTDLKLPSEYKSGGEAIKELGAELREMDSLPNLAEIGGKNPAAMKDAYSALSRGASRAQTVCELMEKHGIDKDTALNVWQLATKLVKEDLRNFRENVTDYEVGIARYVINSCLDSSNFDMALKYLDLLAKLTHVYETSTSVQIQNNYGFNWNVDEQPDQTK